MRERISKTDREKVFKKTGGVCHFCGRKLIFDAKSGEEGRWQVDHILPLSHGGRNNVENYLPICRVCNRLRWNFPGDKIRELFRYGIVANDQVKNKNKTGTIIKNLYDRKFESNKKRRSKNRNLPDSYYK